MNALRLSLIALVFASIPGPQTVRADDALDLIGVWVPVGLESEGTTLTADQVKSLADKLTFTITKEKITAPLGGASTEIGYTLDQKAEPKTIDTVDLNGPQKGELRQGIYELRGDVFRLCMGPHNGKRPGKFTTRPDDDEAGELVVTFLRKKE